LATAQEATPAAGEVVDPSECQVGPRSVESIQQLVGTPPAGGVEATPEGMVIAELTGEEADEATVEAVTATYRELVACLNAGDFLRIYALYTDDYVFRHFAERAQDLEQLQATPSPNSEQPTALVGVSNVRVIEDDRVAARVETHDPRLDGNIVIDAILAQVGDRFLIDVETVAEAPTDDAAEATPAS
jgi:hypothetical protein